MICRLRSRCLLLRLYVQQNSVVIHISTMQRLSKVYHDIYWVCRIGGEFILGCPLGAESRTTVAAFQYWKKGVPVTKLFAERSNKCEFDICCRAHKITNSEQLK